MFFFPLPIGESTETKIEISYPLAPGLGGRCRRCKSDLNTSVYITMGV